MDDRLHQLQGYLKSHGQARHFEATSPKQASEDGVPRKRWVQHRQSSGTMFSDPLAATPLYMARSPTAIVAQTGHSHQEDMREVERERGRLAQILREFDELEKQVTENGGGGDVPASESTTSMGGAIGEDGEEDRVSEEGGCEVKNTLEELPSLWTVSGGQVQGVRRSVPFTQGAVFSRHDSSSMSGSGREATSSHPGLRLTLPPNGGEGGRITQESITTQTTPSLAQGSAPSFGEGDGGQSWGEEGEGEEESDGDLDEEEEVVVGLADEDLLAILQDAKWNVEIAALVTEARAEFELETGGEEFIKKYRRPASPATPSLLRP